MKAALTIGIPVYNEERFLERTIESALGQSFADFEVVVADNCSTDASWEIAQRYAGQDRRVRVLRQARNVGALLNFKSCLDVADTRYFVWLGGHDVFARDYLRAAVDFLERHQRHALAYPKASLIDADDGLLAADCYDDIDTADASLTRRLTMIAGRLSNCVCIHGVFRTQVLRRVPFKDIFGQDILIVFAAASFGQVKLLDIHGISRRVVRQETAAQAMARWEGQGLFDTRDPRYGIYSAMTLEYLEFIRRSPHLTLAEKLVLSARIPAIFAKRFDGAIPREVVLWKCGVRRPKQLIDRLRRLVRRR